MASASTSRVKTNENIQVYLRVRPMNDRERSLRSHEAVDVTSNREVVVKQDHRSTKKFTFDRSFGPDSNQVSVYQSVVAPFIEEVLAGYNCTVFAYGQTGTGKTHTMIGEESPNVANSWDDNSQVGIIPRAVSHLFDELRMMGVEFSMRISFLELYNEELTDLLAATDQTPIKIYDDNTKKGSVIVNGLEELPVHSSADVYKLLAKGQEKRKTASTLMNVQSSRSHTIFSILVHIREYNVDGEEVLKVGKLNLVDLAGSENIGKAGSEKGIRTRETVNINQSLLTLGRVITALVERTPHIPYRESKLTRLLQESLGGRTKTSIIATISPGHRDLEETLSTLEYAHRAKNIQNKPEINQKLTKKLALKEYTEEIDRLKRDLMASRSKNGIYLAEETYAEMNCRLEAQNKELTDKQTTIKVLKDEVAKIQKVFNEVSLNLVEKETELAETYETLHSTKAELGHTVQVLRTTNRRYQEKREIVASHVQTEQMLTSQAQQLKTVAEIASQDTHLLHDTLERRKQTDRNIISVTDNLEKSMHTNITDITSDIDKFNSQIDNQSKIFVEYVENSMTRNADISAKILQKLQEQRSASEQNASDVKKLLEEKMTGDLKCTNEQMEMIKSIIGSAIAEERKINEGVSVMLESLLSSIDAQSTTLSESHTEILNMITGQCELVSNFATTQRNRIQSLATDTTALLTNCRSSVEAVLSKNIETIGNVARLLDDLKTNNENFETIPATITKSIDKLGGASDDQIEELRKMNDEHAKCSNEQTSKLTTIRADIERNENENRNEISKTIASLNNHTKLFAATMKSSKVKILERFNSQKTDIQSAVTRINQKIASGIEAMRSSSADIVDVECGRDKHLNEDSENNLNFKRTVATFVQSFGTASKRKLDTLRNIVVDFHHKDLKVYSPSGMTPAKREFNYPKILAATSPHERIIRRFWSAHSDVSDMEVSMSILEGNETAFLNGVNEVQSSSMVQPCNNLNGLTSSSPIGQHPSMEQFIPILEENNDEQASGVGTSSTPTVEQFIPDRVLSELSVTLSNTPTPNNNVKNEPIIDNPSSEPRNEIPPKCNDRNSNVNGNDSNKENV